jgi:hypothetical protein
VVNVDLMTTHMITIRHDGNRDPDPDGLDRRSDDDAAIQLLVGEARSQDRALGARSGRRRAQTRPPRQVAGIGVVEPIRAAASAASRGTTAVTRTTVDTRSTKTLELLTVSEAARELRIGRTLAYDLAHRYVASHGACGLPVVRLGACLRVPRWALLELAPTDAWSRWVSAYTRGSGRRARSYPVALAQLTRRIPGK